MLGVSLDGSVQGIPEWHEKEEISYRIRDIISPRAAFSVIDRKIKERSIIIIDVPPGTDRPYVADDGIYIWHEGAVKQATPREISSMISSRAEEPVRWERQPASGLDYEDLDGDQVLNTWRLMLDRPGGDKLHARDKTDALDSMRVSASGQIFNSAAVLFAKAGIGLDQSKVKIAAFDGPDRSSFRDSRIIQGGLFHLFDEITSFLERHIPISSHFDGYTRHDNRQLSAFVIRESVMNALVHRDYSQTNAFVMISLHPNRLEIWNPGNLPEGISAESIASIQVSRPVNPDIANIAHVRGLVEQWGSGAGRIVSECRKSGLRDPVWASVGDGVKLTISLAPRAQRDDELNAKQFAAHTQPGEVVSTQDYMESYPNISRTSAFQDLEDLVELGYFVRSPHDDYYVRTDQIL